LTCDEARDLIPAYAARTLPEQESAEIAAHVAGCAVCQEELVQAIRLGHELRQAFSRLPGAPPGTWLAVAARTRGVSVFGVDLGSEAAGFSIGVTATRTGIPVSGRISILGQDVPIFRI